MRRILFAFLMALAFAGAAAAQDVPGIVGGSSAPPGPQPKVIVEHPLFDFGTALEGTMVTHTFTLKNAGKSVLIIRGLKPSCGCTAAKPASNHIAPGQQTTIAVGFDTRFQKGHQVRTITAFTNDPSTPQAVMTMQGTVRQQVAATPSQLAFGNVRKGADETREVTIQDLTGKPGFEVGPVTNSNHAIKVVQEPVKGKKSAVKLKVTLEKSMPLGPFDDTIQVVTDRVPIQIDVFGTVTGDLSVEPVQVSFGIVPKGGDAVRFLKLSNSGPKDIKIIGITSSEPSVIASAQPIKPGKEYKITVELRPGTPEGQVHGQLAIKTDDPQEATLDVPFYAIVGQFKI